jgi:hypothetical protein
VGLPAAPAPRDPAETLAAILRVDREVLRIEAERGKAIVHVRVEGVDATAATAEITWSLAGVVRKWRLVSNGGARGAVQITDEWREGEEVLRRSFSVAQRSEWSALSLGREPRASVVLETETLSRGVVVAVQRDDALDHGR